MSQAAAQDSTTTYSRMSGVLYLDRSQWPHRSNTNLFISDGNNMDGLDLCLQAGNLSNRSESIKSPSPAKVASQHTASLRFSGSRCGYVGQTYIFTEKSHSEPVSL